MSLVTYKETTFPILSNWGTARDIGSETRGPLEDYLEQVSFPGQHLSDVIYVYFPCLIVALYFCFYLTVYEPLGYATIAVFFFLFLTYIKEKHDPWMFYQSF